jgi:hypothetical protein
LREAWQDRGAHDECDGAMPRLHPARVAFSLAPLLRHDGARVILLRTQKYSLGEKTVRQILGKMLAVNA